MAKSRDVARSVFSSSASSPRMLVVRDDGDGYRPARAAEVLSAAEVVLHARMRKSDPLSSPAVVRDYLRVRLGALEHEVFALLMLDIRHVVIEYVELFRGTASQTSVYPREVVKETLARNAAAVILVHNHPSGSPEPSKADEVLTQTLRTSLAVIDVRVLDHLVVTSTSVLSFAERGLM